MTTAIMMTSGYKYLPGYHLAIEKAWLKKRPFIAYAWKANMFRDGQRSQGYLVVSLGEEYVPNVLTPKQAREQVLGKHFPERIKVNIKPDKYDKDIEKLRKQGRLVHLLRVGEDLEIEDEWTL